MGGPRPIDALEYVNLDHYLSSDGVQKVSPDSCLVCPAELSADRPDRVQPGEGARQSCVGRSQVYVFGLGHGLGHPFLTQN